MRIAQTYAGGGKSKKYLETVRARLEREFWLSIWPWWIIQWFHTRFERRGLRRCHNGDHCDIIEETSNWTTLTLLYTYCKYCGRPSMCTYSHYPYDGWAHCHDKHRFEHDTVERVRTLIKPEHWRSMMERERTWLQRWPTG
jgi:hypothetical protein